MENLSADYCGHSADRKVKAWLETQYQAHIPPPCSYSSPLWPDQPDNPTDSKRKADITSPPESPKKWPRTANDSPSEHSNPTILTGRTSFPLVLSSVWAASSRTRKGSLVRNLINGLCCCHPSIHCDNPTDINLPGNADALRRHLTKDFGQKIIPIGLKPLLRNIDPRADEIPASAFDTEDTRTQDELRFLWDAVEDTHHQANECGKYNKDENAWCLHVVQRILFAALKLSKTDKIQLTSVQSQTIDPRLLPQTSTEDTVSKKADYAFAFSTSNPDIAALYKKLSLKGLGYGFSHTTDAFTERVALFSGIEVKLENGGKSGALGQLAIWLAAGLRKVLMLGKIGSGTLSSIEVQPMVGFTVIGHDWYTYIAYVANLTAEEGNEEVMVVGPIELDGTNTHTLRGIFRLIDLIKRTINFAADTYWPWLERDILAHLPTRE